MRPIFAGLDYPGFRVDLSLIGEITNVRTDGVLWYVTMCNLPDVRIMCVTYKSNDMKPGDRVLMKGGYNRSDANHAMLDHVWRTGRTARRRTSDLPQSQGISSASNGPPDVRQSRWQ